MQEEGNGTADLAHQKQTAHMLSGQEQHSDKLQSGIHASSAVRMSAAGRARSEIILLEGPIRAC